MPRDTGNPDCTRAAAQHVAKALTRCHPGQRAQMLHAIIAQAELALAVGRGDHFSFVPERSFADQARELVGVDLATVQ